MIIIGFICICIVLIICILISIRAMKEKINNDLYIYPKNKHRYLCLEKCKLKCPSTGNWYNAVIYEGIDDGNYYVREEKDFFAKFIKLKDWKDGNIEE